MSRWFGAFGVYLAVVVANLSTVASAQDAFVTRIEPRPFYGATITIEEGVRVFRPLPPTQQIIINPTQAPLNITTNTTVDRRAASADNGVNDGSGGGNGDAHSDGGNGGYSEPTTSYPNYGSAFDGSTYGSQYGGDYGAKGRRLQGFAPHGVRVNGYHTPYTTGHSGRSGYDGFQPQALTAFGQRGRHAKSHALNLPPLGYGAPRHGQAYAHGGYPNGYRLGGHPGARPAQAQRWSGSHSPVHHGKVNRPHTFIQPTMRPPVTTHIAPHVTPMAPRVTQAPRHAPGHAAPRPAGQGHAAPAGHIGMGMGRR